MTRLSHLGLLYQDPQDLLRHTVPFVRQGLENDEPVLVAQPQAQLDALSQTFSGVPEIKFVDMQQAGHNPGRILPWVLHAFALEHPGRRVRIVGEPIWPGRDEVAYPACVQHEAMVNIALGDLEATVLCSYDAPGLPERAVNDAYHTHPLMIDSDSVAQPNSVYSFEQLVTFMNSPLPTPPAGATRLPFSLADLRAVRETATTQGLRSGLGQARIAELQLAVNEAATNAILHGGGKGTLFVWSDNGCVVCEVRSGLPLPPLTAGRLQPPPGASSGRGLLLINHLCDLVQWHSVGDDAALRLWLSPDRAAF